jgi:UDP-N-acetylglucosamine acyltransferase
MCSREPAAYCGLNLVGLRRRGFSNELIENIHNAYRLIYQSKMPLVEAIKKIKEEIPSSPEIDYIVSFIEDSKRGFVH